MDRKEELNLIINAAREELYDIEEREAEKLSLKLVGKHFKYRNSYSCPEKPSDYWWLYSIVLRAEGSWVHAIDFQKDKDGKIEIEPNKMRASRMLGYQEISATEYRKALKGILLDVEKALGKK